MALSRYIHRALLNHLLKGTAYTQPTHIYVAAFTVAPDSQGADGTEVTGGSYARVIHDTWDPATDADPAVASNDGAIEFVQATASWGTVVHVGLYDALTGGNYLGGGTVSKAIDSGDQLVIADGDLDISLGAAA